MLEQHSEVDRLASSGSSVFGAPDYLPLDAQLASARSLIVDLHAEISRLERLREAAVRSWSVGTLKHLRAAVDPRDVRRRRLRRAKADLRAQRLTVIGYLRVVAWIWLKGRRHDRALASDLLLKRARYAEGQRELRRSDLVGSGVVDSAVRDGDLDRAHVAASALALADPSVAHLKLLKSVAVKRGSLTLSLALDRKLQPHLRTTDAALRLVEGRARELSGWVPRIAGTRVEVPPSDARTIMHLVKESRPYLSNGFTSRSQRNFVAELRAGLRPVVVTEPGFPSSDLDPNPPRVEYVEGIEHRRLLLASVETGKTPVDTWLSEFAQAAYEELLKIRPAVIHASSGRRGYETALVGLALKEKTGLPLVYEVRSFFESTWTGDVRHEESGEVFARRSAVEMMCIDQADHVLTLGTAMRDELISRGADPGKISLIPNGVDLESFSVVERDRQLAEAQGIGDAPTFGYVSNMDHHRESQETLVRAAAELKKRGSDARCVIVGGGPRRATIEALASKLDVADRVVFTGSVDHHDVPKYYSLIDVFVVPRIDERAARYVTPLKPFEAMALGRPIVTSRLPALTEITEPPARGLDFAPGDATELADVLERLFSSPDERERLAIAGRRWIEDERQWDMNGMRYRRVFERVMTGGVDASNV